MRLSKLNPTSLRFRVALAVAIVFIGSMSLMALLMLRFFENEFRENLYKEHFKLVSSIANNLDEKLRMAQDSLVAGTVNLPAEIFSSPVEAQKFIDRQNVLRSFFDNSLILVASNGSVIAANPFRRTRGLSDFSSREYFKSAVSTKKPTISQPFLSATPPLRPLLVMAAPVLDKKGRLLGILQGSFDLTGQNILADLNKIKIGKEGYLALSNKNRLMIISSDPKRTMTPAAGPGINRLLDRALAGYEGSGQTVNSAGVPMYATFKHLNTVDWLLSANLPVSEAEEPLQKVRHYVYAATALGTALILTISWIIMLRMLWPMQLFLRHLQQLPNKKGAERLMESTRVSEVDNFITAFNQLIHSHDEQQRVTHESEDRFRSLTELSTDWYWEQDRDFRFTLMSQGLSPISVKSTLGKTRWELPIPGVTPAQWEAHRKLLERHESFKDFVYQIQATSGEMRTFSISGAPFYDARGEFLGYRGIGTDITDRVDAEKKIEFLAYHDALTGLPNRLLMQDRCEQAMAQAERYDTKVALAYLDLDNFKSINDSLGHDVGDLLLRKVALRIQECVRDTDTISRQGGDEFLVVLRDLSEVDAASTIMLKIMGRLQEPFEAQGQEVLTSVSMGAAIYPDDGKDFETLRKLADMAMYQAKNDGRNTYRFFDAAMNTEAGEHLFILNGLHHALVRNEFELHFQPQINLSSNQITGVEALIRWNHPELGQIAPARFIHIAEESGLIVPIGDWVLQEACRQAVAWQRAGLPEITMAVNLSAVQFKRGDVEQSVIRALEGSGFNPQRLELELTESTLIQNVESVLATVKRIKLLGVNISIDDFGTGYSSLSYLKRFDIDKLKIDQSFVRDLATDPEDAAIVRAIIQMARSLNLQTIAEGVESSEILHQLKVFKCDEAQGYLFARPVPASDIASLLTSKRKN
jgi:diguanylate cyclase (GGDEF)-like protein/PAS domain S-box-containing protein